MLIFGDPVVWFGAGIFVLFVASIFALLARSSAPPPMKAFVLSEEDRSFLLATAARLRKNSRPGGRRDSRMAVRPQSGGEGGKVAD